jgi:hypothetical protein
MIGGSIKAEKSELFLAVQSKMLKPNSVQSNTAIKTVKKGIKKHISDEDTELFEEKICRQCANESVTSCCPILSKAIRNSFPSQWQISDGCFSCEKFVPCNT